MANQGNQIASKVTDGMGEYYFTDSDVPGRLKFKHSYELRVNLG
jgi:hypothetical protein